MAAVTEPQSQEDSPSTSSSPELSALLSQTPHAWRLTANGTGIERGFRFKTFKKAWDFMSAVAQECKGARHHPEWSNPLHPPPPQNNKTTKPPPLAHTSESTNTPAFPPTKVYNTVFIRWTTHAPSPAHLSAKDTQMAQICDARGREFDELEPSAEEAQAAAEAKGREEGGRAAPVDGKGEKSGDGEGDLLAQVVCAGGGEGRCCVPPTGKTPTGNGSGSGDADK
ncbi:MAG: hypothetical protein M1819_001697 [Sarea resinae]|nr:MAG: hypothetical protein M1819_001697 [Sarea resinae]